MALNGHWRCLPEVILIWSKKLTVGVNKSDNIEDFVPRDLVGCHPSEPKIFQLRLWSFKMPRFCEQIFSGPMEVRANSSTAAVRQSGFVFSLFRCSLRLEDVPRDGMDLKPWIEIYLPKSIAIIRNDGKIVLRFSMDFRRIELPAMWGWCEHKLLPWYHGRLLTHYAVP
ncbi:hypothetical protein AVEN_27681-1, partial [Araneus ventricosus]